MKPMPECPVPIDLESSSVSGHDVRITVDEAVIDEDDGGECLKTPSVSPNNSFIQVTYISSLLTFMIQSFHGLSYNKLMQEHLKNSDISPSLRDLEPGYVSNLAEFWTQKVWLRFRPHCHFVIVVFVYFRL